MSGLDRISVVRNNQMVPLIPSHARRTHAHGEEEQPWRGVLLEHHTVSAIEIPEHEHRELCLHLQTSGNLPMEWWSAGRHGIAHTSPGTMILLPPGTRDRLRWQGSSERLILSLDPGLMESTAEELGGTSPEFEMHWALQDAGLQQIVLDMGRQASQGWPLGRLYADLTVNNFASLLLRRHAINPVHSRTKTGGLPLPQLRLAIEYITANLHRDVSLEEVAHAIRLSPFHFARSFRDTTGQTPYQYLLDQRMDRAKHLLKTRDWPIQEIAGMTGFRSPVNFVRTFRQRVGQAPGEWRKMYRS